MVIRKKSWPNIFERIRSGKKTIDVRIGDFPKLSKQFPMILEEWDPKTHKYTGRRLKVSARVLALADVLSFYSVRELMSYPIVVLEYERIKEKKERKRKT